MFVCLSFCLRNFPDFYARIQRNTFTNQYVNRPTGDTTKLENVFLKYNTLRRGVALNFIMQRSEKQTICAIAARRATKFCLLQLGKVLSGLKPIPRCPKIKKKSLRAQAIEAVVDTQYRSMRRRGNLPLL